MCAYVYVCAHIETCRKGTCHLLAWMSVDSDDNGGRKKVTSINIICII